MWIIQIHVGDFGFDYYYSTVSILTYLLLTDSQMVFQHQTGGEPKNHDIVLTAYRSPNTLSGSISLVNFDWMSLVNFDKIFC